MKLLDMTRSKSSSPTYDTAITLDYLWDQASALGRVKVDHGIIDGQYVEIQFKRKSGSLVYAKGYSSDIREAFRLVIAEAVALGARP